MQLDIKKFFNRIDRPLLFNMIQQRLGKSHQQSKITSQQAVLLQGLSHTLLKHNAAEGAQQRGNPLRFLKVPAHKRLVNAPLNKGIPIGNLTSQFFANVYLNALDQFVKHQLKCRCYVRYVDDFVLLHHDRQRLLQWQQQIQQFLHSKLKLFSNAISPCAILLSQRGFKTDFVKPAKDQSAGSFAVGPGLFAQRIRASVKRLQLVEEGYLKGGLMRRIIQTMTIHQGVKLCGES